MTAPQVRRNATPLTMSFHRKTGSECDMSVGDGSMKPAVYVQQPGKPKPPGNPPSHPEPDRKAPIEEPPEPTPVMPPEEDEPPPMDATHNLMGAANHA